MDNYRPVLLKGLRAKRFEATFYHPSGNNSRPLFVLNAADQDDYDYIDVIDKAIYDIEDGGVRSIAVDNASSGGSPEWIRVTCNGSSVAAKRIAGSTEPTETDWTNASVAIGTSDLDFSRGMIGFLPFGSPLLRNRPGGSLLFDPPLHLERLLLLERGVDLEVAVVFGERSERPPG